MGQLKMNTKSLGSGGLDSEYVDLGTSDLDLSVNYFGPGFQYGGKVLPTTNPGIPHIKIFYLANTPGTYPNFGNIVLEEGEIAFLKFDSAWTKETLTIAYSRDEVYSKEETYSKEEIDSKGSTPKVKKLSPYFYELEADTLDYDYAYNHYLEAIFTGGCSAVKKGNLVGRNYDWFYDHTASFFIKTPAQYGKHAVMGICGGIRELTGELVDKGQYSDKYKVLPFMLQDGINDAGLYCSVNLAPIRAPRMTPEGLCNTFLVRYILENFDTVDAALAGLQDLRIFNHPILQEMGYELQYFISSNEAAYSIEVTGNGIIATPTTKLTNFHISDVHLNSDGSIFTPETGHLQGDYPSQNNIYGYESGLERWNLIVSSDKELEELMRDLFFTNAYREEAINKWYSEFVGGNLDINSRDWPEFLSRYAQGVEGYANRSRDTGMTWHTVHSCIYDLEGKTIKVISQQEYEHSFRMRESQFSVINGELCQLVIE